MHTQTRRQQQRSEDTLAARAYLYQYELTLDDLNRLDRRCAPDQYATHLLARLRNHLESVDAIVWPTAADLVEHGATVEYALAIIDRRAKHVTRAAA